MYVPTITIAAINIQNLVGDDEDDGDDLQVRVGVGVGVGVEPLAFSTPFLLWLDDSIAFQMLQHVLVLEQVKGRSIHSLLLIVTVEPTDVMELQKAAFSFAVGVQL